MNKALPCPICKTDRYLQWKAYSHIPLHWIHCDDCGKTGPQKPTQAEAGRAWNEEVGP